MKIFSLSLICILFVGCAASNGGGHVVGNGLQPEGFGVQEACDCKKPNQPSECGCGNPKKKEKGGYR